MSERPVEEVGKARFRRLLYGYQRSALGSIAPAYLSLPTEVEGQKYEFKPVPLVARGVDYHQPWSGYAPKCTLEDQEDCKYYPCLLYTSDAADE